MRKFIVVTIGFFVLANIVAWVIPGVETDQTTELENRVVMLGYSAGVIFVLLVQKKFFLTVKIELQKRSGKQFSVLAWSIVTLLVVTLAVAWFGSEVIVHAIKAEFLEAVSLSAAATVLMLFLFEWIVFLKLQPRGMINEITVHALSGLMLYLVSALIAIHLPTTPLPFGATLSELGISLAFGTISSWIALDRLHGQRPDWPFLIVFIFVCWPVALAAYSIGFFTFMVMATLCFSFAVGVAVLEGLDPTPQS